MTTRAPLAPVNTNHVSTAADHNHCQVSQSGRTGTSMANQISITTESETTALHSQKVQCIDGKSGRIEEDTPHSQQLNSSDRPIAANASTTPDAPPPIQQSISKSERTGPCTAPHGQSNASEGHRLPSAPASKGPHQPFPSMSDKRSASDQCLAQRPSRPSVEGRGIATAASEETLQFDIATLKQAFTAQYHSLAAKCQGWERYAAKLKAQLEALEIDHSLMKETCAQQTMEAQRLEARVESQTKYIERLEAENGDLREMYRERENRSREVESRLSSLEERLAARAPSSAASTAASLRRAPTGSASRMASQHMEQHVQSVLKNVYQPPSPPSSVTDSSQSRTHMVGPPQDGRAAFHSSNIRYSSDDEERMQRDFRAPSPLDFGNLDNTLAQPVLYRSAQATAPSQAIARPASRASSRQAQHYGSGNMAARDEAFPPPREGGRESRLGHRRPDEGVKQHVGGSAGEARCVDDNGSAHAGEGESSELIKGSHSNGVQPLLHNDEQPYGRPHSRLNHTREGAPSPPSLDARTDNRPRGIDRTDKQVLEGAIFTNAYPSHFVRSTSALGLAAPQYPFVRSGSAASIQTVTSSNGMTGSWPHVRSSTDPLLATIHGQQATNVVRPLRRSSFHQQQQLAQMQSRRNSVTTSRLSNYSSDGGTGQIPVRRGGSRMPSSRNGSVGVHDAIPIVKDDVFSDGKQNILPATTGRKSSISSVAKARIASSRPSGAPGQGQGEQSEQNLAPQQIIGPPDGRTSALANHYNERHVPAQMLRGRDSDEVNLAPGSHFSPPSSSGREEQRDASSSTQYATSLPLSQSTNQSIIQDVSCASTSASVAEETSAIAAAEARRGAHRRLYLCLREELSPEDLQKFERYVHRYDALEIPVDGPRGLVNRVKKLLLLSDATLRERPEEWKRRKELAREFERVVSADT
ncbi:hypothetical protein BCV69DRAFT_76481 [Microstroma glucosiphilum]|uniref:Uncharacterized protein n=1 Tax=Pseudomicrostroma glucosiphilum TaxID=1684307 RepID=A0A316U0W9_9BASI|nr:hypothetical protein BCV69DRAFT_76481 [Pseudomicrostroma glucosiphilum]PWN18514.1 hypothetical protein BCV69DRAFT_76481 [Pseudomicrostroma glucosiphilum]